MKVKSIDKLERISSGVTVHLTALVTYTDGVKEVQVQVRGEQQNPYNHTKEEHESFIQTSFKTAVAAQGKALDDQVVETAKMETLKTTILSDLTKAGLTVLLALMLFLAPVLSWAGTLQPEWGDAAVVVLTDSSSGASGTVTSGVSMGPSALGIIDSSTYYMTHIWINAFEEGNNPSGNLGVSVWAVESTSGVTKGNAPLMVFEISAAEATPQTAAGPGSGSAVWGGGITKYLLLENIPYILIGVKGNHASDVWHVKGKYRRERGQY